MIKTQCHMTDERERRVMKSHLRASPEFAAYMIANRVCEHFVQGPLDLRDKALPQAPKGNKHA